VGLHYVPASKAPLAITALADYEAALLAGDSGHDHIQTPDDPLSQDSEDLLSPESRLHLRPEVDVIKLPADYQEIVRRLRQKGPLHDIPEKQVKVAIRRVSSGPAEARQLTPLSAQLLDLCADGLTVEEIAGEFFLRNIEIPGIPLYKACLAGLEILRQQRLLALA
jgi:hypothetical protein